MFLFRHVKAALARSRNQHGCHRSVFTTKNDFEHARGPSNSAYTFWTRQTYISREISIEHPSVGLASLAQLEIYRMVILTYTHTYTHTYIHTHIHTYTHTYIHTHIHTYIHRDNQCGLAQACPFFLPTLWKSKNPFYQIYLTR